MKFIDEKGRLFGKWNIIDFLVVIFILCLTPMGYYAWKLCKAPKTTIGVIEINWEQKYNEESAKHNEEVQKIKTFCKEHKRASICR